MFNGMFQIREPVNEPVLGYEPGSPARAALKAELERMLKNPVEGPGPVIGPPVLNDVNLGGVHFTGSTYVFSGIWLTIGSDIRKYHSYPRIVGAPGGESFVV